MLRNWIRLRYRNRVPMIALPEGDYPFIDERLPLSQLTMVEAPAQLEALFKSEAAKREVSFARDVPIELRCRSDEISRRHLFDLLANRIRANPYACSDEPCGWQSLE